MYSENDTVFSEVGWNFGELRRALSNDPIATAELESYRDGVRTTTELLVAACATGAYPVYAGAAKKKWEGTYTAMAVGSAGFVAISIITDCIARHHLTKAVDGYNRRHPGGSKSPTASIYPVVLNHRAVGLEVSLQF